MAITHNAERNTWGFVPSTKRLDGYATREAAAEALYDLERGTAPALPPDVPLDSVEAEIIDWILAQTKRKPGALTKAVLEYVAEDQNDIEEDLIDLATHGREP